MNKKFSTLMAGLMLASAFSVSAQTPSDKYEDGKYYLLGIANTTNATGKILSVTSTVGSKYGEIELKDYENNLTAVRNALWKVTVTQEKYGDTPTFSFVNVATGQYLSVKTPSSVNDIIGDKEDVMITGNFMEWYNGLSSTGITVTAGSPLMSYINANEVVYLAKDKNENLLVKRGTPEEAAKEGIMIVPATANIVPLYAEELNKELIMNNKVGSFTLSFDRDVTEGAENLFTGVSFVAENVLDGDKKSTGYVNLKVKDTENYLVVDTALHTGSEADKQLPKFAYDVLNKEVVDGNNVKRLSGSFNFKFAYDPTNNRVLIKVQEYVKKIKYAKPAIVNGAQTGDGNNAYTYWPTGTYSYYNEENKLQNDGDGANNIVKDAYVRLVELSSVRELTVASEAADGIYADDKHVDTDFATADGEWLNPDDLTYGMLTNVTIGKGLMTYVPTTIPTGLYLIQYIKGDETDAAANDYFIANLKGVFGYAEQAKNQNFDHMPAAQWYVKQQGTIATAPVTITNREFFDQKEYNGYEFLAGAQTYQAFEADGNYYFASGAFNGETLKFIPVSAASKADSLVGYKHVDAEQASVETYVFNYLHGLALDKGLNTPSDKDSLVRVDETGEKVAFRLVPVVEHDSYGLQNATGVANLIRNAYYIKAYDNLKFAADNADRYLTYDEKSKKYVMTTTPTPYFLKENNCIDGTHYYALVEAEFYNLTLADLEDVNYSDGNQGKFNFDLNKYYAPEYAGMSKDDAKSYSAIYEELKEKDPNTKYMSETHFYFFDKNGQPIVKDASKDVALYAYQLKNDVVTLQRIKDSEAAVGYAYMNRSSIKGDNNYSFADFYSTDYAEKRISVDDNTLDLTQAVLSDKFTESEIRVSAFEIAINDAPLYRRFNGVAPETYGDASNAPLNLKFYRFNNPAEYLFENYASENKYRDGITDKSISFLGVNNAYQFEETATRSYTMFVDTAYVRNNTRMPQYLIGIRPEVVEGDTILCDASTHQHKTPEEALACEHTQIKVGFTRAMYLFNAQDSIAEGNYDYQGKAAYGAAGYTRLAFKDAVHAQDTLYILNPGVTTEQLIEGNFKNDDLFAGKIGLGDNKHKNVVFQFRLLDEDNNRFLIESEAEQNGKAVLNSALTQVCIAPEKGGWVKVQNGVPVIARFDTFKEASAQADVFDVNDEIKYDATANDEIAVEGVSVVAGNGQVTIMGAAGKNVTITNILGKVIASQVIASDNATIAVPAGIVAVAVEGEDAVKAIVK